MDSNDLERKIIGILRVLSHHTDPVGAVAIARELEPHGIHLDRRTVRYHLKNMDERRLTEKHGREGRMITQHGRQELRDSLVFDRIGYVSSRIESLSFQTTFDPDRLEGKVIVNTAFIPLDQLDEARKIIASVLERGIGLSRLVAFRREGETIGDVVVPEGMAGIGTMCSIVINGIFIKQGIPVEARFGGVIEMEDNHPRRFTEIIAYAGTSADPLELFMRGSCTAVLETLRTGAGKVLANFREIPAEALPIAEDILAKLKRIGITGVLAVSHPGQTLFGVSTSPNRCGIAVMGGINSFAACHESGIRMNIRAISTLADYDELAPVVIP